MKKIMLLASVTLLAAACTDPDDNCQETREPMGISAVIADITPTRTTITGSTAAWAENDAIGVFSPQASTPGVNVQYTVTGVASTPVWATTTPLFWFDGSTSHTFTAYAPYASGNTAAASVKIPALNSQNGVIASAQDFLISNNYATTGVTRPGPVALTFTHAFSLIEFDMTIGNGLAAGTTLTSFAVAGGTGEKLFTSDANSTIALATGAITAGTATNTITVTPATPPVLSSTASAQYLLLLPGTYTAPTLVVSIKDGGSTAYTLASVPVGTTTFEAGKKYKYAVNVNRTAISISSATITDWTTVNGSPISPIL